jgi:flagellar basal-body rod modification protein FlgD
MASAVSALSGSSTATDSSQASTLANATPSKEMFLQLLVAQIKNQDPLNPTDSVQFVSQLAQFSQLEQVIGIRQDIEGQMASSSTSASTATPSAEQATT